MVDLRRLPPTAVLASLLVGSAAGAEKPPQLLPTSDVDISYDVTLPSQSRIRERVRWLAAEQLERVDGPHKSTTIFNRRTHEITLLSSADRTFRQLDMPHGRRRSPRRRPHSSAAMNRSLRDCTASTGLGAKTWKRALCASPRAHLRAGGPGQICIQCGVGPIFRSGKLEAHSCPDGAPDV
jgi:hypothetical protein